MDEQNDEFTGQSNYNREEDYDTEHSNDEYEDTVSEDDYESIDYQNLEDKWYAIEDEYRARYADLTEDDVAVTSGSFHETVDRIGRRRGRTRREIRTEIENW